MDDAAPSCYVSKVTGTYVHFGYRAKCGVFYATADDPWRAAYLACRKCREEPYPYWRTHKTGPVREWAGIHGRSHDDTERHLWLLMNKGGA